MTLKSNSRLLYIEQNTSEINLSDAIQKIDQYIHNSIHLEKAYNDIIVQFSAEPFSADFDLSRVKVGREIVGFDSEVFNEVHYSDFGEYDYDTFPLIFSDKWDEVYKQIERIDSTKAFFRLNISDDLSIVDAEFK